MLHLPRHPGERPVPSPEIIAKVTARAEADPDWGGEDFTWDHWRGLPREFFQDLTQEERVVLAYSDFFHSHLLDLIQEEEPLFRRIRQSVWFYGRENWNTIVDAYEKIMTFSFNEPGFRTEIDYLWSTVQGYGSSQHCLGRWLDGTLAFHLYKGDELVAILGFSVCDKGLLIQQAQATSKRGGRGLFGQRSLLEVRVQKMAWHFDMPVWIVDGKDQAKYLNHVHPKNTSPMTVGDLFRIAELYDRDIPGFFRTGETYTPGSMSNTGARTHHRLFPLGLNADEQKVFKGLTKTMQEKVLYIAEYNRLSSGLVAALLITAKFLFRWKWCASITREDMKGWHLLAETALRMLDFDVSLERALRTLQAACEPTIERASKKM